jgi:outer membrane lipoprotein SlyB
MSRRRIFVVMLLQAAAGGCQLADEPLGETSANLSEASGAATVDLIAIGSITGSRADRSHATSATLENGVAGNLLGGVGSGLAYAGGHIFLAVPDRGPNAVAFNPAVDDTASYINRFQTFFMTLHPSAPGSALPFDLEPILLDTTLLHSAHPLHYATGTDAGLASGAPALNAARHTHYFTGRSDNFAPATLSTDADDARFDPEGIRVSPDGRRVFMTDEYGPHVYEFDRWTGARVRSFALPAEFAVPMQSSRGDVEISGNTVGRVANKGMEGLAISPDGRTLIGAMQSPLIQDGGTDAQFTRIVTIDVRTGHTRQYAYPLTNIGTKSKPKYPTVSEILAINDHEFLVDERDGKGRGDDSVAAFKQIFHIDLAGAQDVAGKTGEANLAGAAVAKALFVDVVAVLTAHGIAAQDIPAKLEGMALGPDVHAGSRGVRLHTLWIANDNDFVATIVDSHHPAGIDNPNQFFVFGVDPSLVPDLERPHGHEH